MPDLGDLKWNLSHSVQNSSYHMLLFQCSCLLFSSTLPLAHTYSDSSGPRSRTLHKIRTLGQRNTQGIGHKYCRSRGLREMEVQPWDTFIKFPPFSGHSVSHWGTKFNKMHKYLCTRILFILLFMIRKIKNKKLEITQIAENLEVVI